VLAIKNLEKKNNKFLILFFLFITLLPLKLSSDDKLNEEGRVLAHFAGCFGCHTNNKNAEYAGGYSIKTQYGIFVTPNITSDETTGIGKWTESEFINAVKKGINPKNKPYYPSFPFFWYEDMKDEDIKKIYYYLKSTTPVNKKNTSHSLKFPYNIRELVWVWRFLSEKIEKSSQKITLSKNGKIFERGQYLVETVGHCGACHSPRTWLSLIKNKNDLSGKKESNKNLKDGAPDISSNKVKGIGDWSSSDIVFFMETGIKPNGDFASDTMQYVIENSTSFLNKKDLKAIAHYLLNSN